MKYITIITVALVFLSTSCSKTNKKKITYMASNAYSEYDLQYLNENNVLIKTTIKPQSVQDKWEYNYFANDGDIIYLSGIYHDINSSLKVAILIDGKIYKQGSSVGDTLQYLTVSGTVPY